MNIPAIVPVSMPPAAAVPIERFPMAPAPLASISGMSPQMNANDVIRMGRSLLTAPARAALIIGVALLSVLAGHLHYEDGVLAKQAYEHYKGNLGVDVVFKAQKLQE